MMSSYSANDREMELIDINANEMLDALRRPMQYDRILEVARNIIARDRELYDTDDSSAVSELSSPDTCSIAETVDTAVRAAMSAQAEQTAIANAARAAKGAVTRAANLKMATEAAEAKAIKDKARADKCRETKAANLKLAADNASIAAKATLFDLQHAPQFNNPVAFNAHSQFTTQPSFDTRSQFSAQSPFNTPSQSSPFGSPPPTNTSSNYTYEGLALLNVQDLRAMASNREFKGYSKLKKAELIEKLLSD